MIVSGCILVGVNGIIPFFFMYRFSEHLFMVLSFQNKSSISLILMENHLHLKTSRLPSLQGFLNRLNESIQS